MKEKDQKKKYLIFLVVILFFLLIAWIRVCWENACLHGVECAIEYGKGECIDGFLRIPFYNSGIKDITRIKITVPFGTETNITLPADFNVNEPLVSGKTGVLGLVPCEKEISIDNFDIQWCCGDECHTSKMNSPQKNVSIEDKEKLGEGVLIDELLIQNETGYPESDETYPPHPKLSDCEKITDPEKTGTRNFCLSDVAEIESNSDICEFINDPDIKKFCIARVSLDKTLCGEIIDEGLKGACFENIDLKAEWSSRGG